MTNMKKLLIAFVAILSSALSASADNIEVKDITLKQGETATIDIELENPSKAYTAFQLDLMLPEGITATTNDEGDYIITNGSRLSSNHTIGVSPIEGGIRLVCVSPLSEAFSGTSGSLFTIEVKADVNIQAKDYIATVTGVVFTSTGDRDIEMDDADFTISVESTAKPGDANGDGEVTIADVVAVVNYITTNGNPAGQFIEGAADVDGVEGITIADAIAIVNMILSSGSSE